MSLFASTGFGTSNVFGAAAGTQQNTTTAAPNSNPMKDIEVSSPPDDTVTQLAFSPVTTNNAVLLAASSWDNSIRVWEVQGNGQSVPKAMQTHAAPVLDVCWNDEGTQLFTASCDNTGKIWDLASNQTMQFAQHSAPIRSVHYVKSPSYTCILTTSWDKTMRLWDTRQPGQCVSVDLPERSYASAVRWPVGVVTTANRHLIVYNLENPTKEFRTVESPLKYQHRCVAVFVDHKKSPPTPSGFAVGSIEGRVAIQYLNPPSPKDNFTFKCHRSEVGTDGCQDIYAVNKCVFHPTNGKLATVGSDGRFSFWDIYARTKLKTSEQFEAPLTTGCFDAQGNVFAYAVGYDWSKGHEHFDPARKPRIFMRLCEADFRSQAK